jgi:N-acetylglucosamine malate deacetylase 1
MNRISLFTMIVLVGLTVIITSPAEIIASEPQRTILAIGAHAGDMEVSCGAVLAKHAKMGDRVVILHLTLGERGNPDMSPEQYGAQKLREAEHAAEILGAEVIFGPYKDGEIPNDESARRYVNDIIRQVKPTHIITHWKYSIHKDHTYTHAIVTDAVLLASLEGVESEYPRHRGIRGIYFTENWEDMEEYTPYLFVDVTETFSVWQEAVRQYEFIGGDISAFPYFDYYTSLARVRGALARVTHVVTFNISEFGKRRNLDSLP